jgi:hypothetical protein
MWNCGSRNEVKYWDEMWFSVIIMC